MTLVDANVFAPDDYLDVDIRELLKAIINRTIELKASDLFLLAQPNGFMVAVRCQGEMQTVMALSRERGGSLINTIKTSANMDLSEKSRPHDGRWRFEEEDASIDFRVNSMGTIFGEDLALRVLARETQLFNLDYLGFEARQQSQVKTMVENQGGLVLVTGPTGSGKTTTLYACLNYLNNGIRKINTLEDPVEYAFTGIRQSQVNTRRGLDFADLLRGALRQSPDVIMVGEIRDSETAETAVRAANSGHLVLTTLHAPVSTTAVQSMLAFGIHPFFLASCLQGVISQRLIRQLNPDTRIGYDIGHIEETFGEVKSYLAPGEGVMIYGPDSSDQNHGYSALTGLFEILSMNSEIKNLIAKGAPATELRRNALDNGLLDFRKAALLKVARGITSIEEISRQIPSEFLDIDCWSNSNQAG